MNMTDKHVKYEYGCGDPECRHDTPEEALAHIREQQRQWWDSLTVKQRVKFTRLRADALAYQAARQAFKRLTTETGGRVQ